MNTKDKRQVNISVAIGASFFGEPSAWRLPVPAIGLPLCGAFSALFENVPLFSRFWYKKGHFFLTLLAIYFF
ncbi:MAG: hypothetical protein V1908_01515 [Candidatus Peregrinibacteria bacterium]